MHPKLMVRALFVVAMFTLVIDLLTRVRWLGMIIAVLAWKAFVSAYQEAHLSVN